MKQVKQIVITNAVDRNELPGGTLSYYIQNFGWIDITADTTEWYHALSAVLVNVTSQLNEQIGMQGEASADTIAEIRRIVNLLARM